MPVPVDLSKPSDVVKNDVVQKDVYNKLVAKVNSIDTTGFVLKTKYDTDKSELKKKIPNVTDFVKKASITELENKIPDISNLATKTTLTTVENKIPDVSGLATKTALTAVENKIPDVTNLATKTALTTLENKIPDVSSLVKKTDYNARVAEIDTELSSLDGKIAENKAKNESIKKELVGAAGGILLYSFGHIMFDGRDGFQAYLIFQPVHKYIKIIANTRLISEWKSKGLSDESNKPFPTSDNSLTPLIDYFSYKMRVKFNWSILRQPKVSYTHGKPVNIYIVYKLIGSSSHSDDPTLKNCLFGAITLTKNADIDKYGYSGYGIGFDRRSSFTFPGGGFGRNVLIFDADMSSSTHIDNKKRHIISRKGPTQGLEHTLTAEKMYSINFTETKNKFCLSLHYNGANSYLFINGEKIVKFKVKDSEIVASPICLETFQKIGQQII